MTVFKDFLKLPIPDLSDGSKQPGVLYKAKVTLYFIDNLEPTSLEVINQLALGNSTFNITLAISGILNLLSFSEMNASLSSYG